MQQTSDQRTPLQQAGGTPSALFIGGGNMARAILEGAVAGRALDPARVIVAEPGADKHAPFAALGARPVTAAGDGLALLDQLDAPRWIVLAVKPQVLPEVSAELRASLAGRVDLGVITMLAGVPSDGVRASLGGAVRVVRVMPNTPAQIRRGCTAVCAGAGAIEGDAGVAERLFAAVGEVIPLEESLIDAFTGVAGSGPAYLFRMAEAMEAGAIEAGLDADDARRIVRSVLTGSSLLLSSRGGDPGALREAVTSKKGTTAAGLDALQAGGFEDAVRSAILAARDRGAALAELASESG
ncbi:MAG: pyrroline-5-carboxylate reductase [Planctomycetota bacterium]